VQKIVGAHGKVLADQNSPGERALDPDVAACEQNVLRHVVVGPENHTGGNANVDGQNIFGKTGTTDNRSDAWFIGATPQLATAVWFGNWRAVVGGAGFGGDSAAPVFQAFMSQALAGQPAIPLPDPGPVCARAGQFDNPDGGRSDNSPIVPVTPQLPTVQQVPTNQTTPSATTPQATTPTTPQVTVPNTRPNGKP
jgi:penicillin-binding protein 1A